MGIGRVVRLAAMVVFAVNAQDRAGNQIFHIPPDWVRSDTPPTTILSPSAEPKNMVVIMLAGHPLNGDFRAAFDRDVAAMNGTQVPAGSGEVQSRHIPSGIDLLAVTWELKAPNGARSGRYYMAASVRGRYELLTYMAASPVLFKRYWPAVQQFITTWSFANLTDTSGPPAEAVPAPPPVEAAPAASPAPNRLDGVYGGYKFIYTTVLGAVQRKAVNDYFSFFPNGTVFWGLPQTGLAGFNMARECQGRVEFCGSYQMNGDQVLIVLNRGTYRQAGVRSPVGLQIGDRQYTLMGDPAKAAAHGLDGRFVRADARPGEDLARRFIRFTRDGRFVDQGIVTTVTSSDISTGNPRFERQAGMGTYQLAPYTLILRYSDGYVRQLGVTIKPSDMDQPMLSQLFVNTYTLVRR
jgi:hypothetical protein